jgi:Reverse transcriptase (RNA-dependent DNA polymerase)
LFHNFRLLTTDDIFNAVRLLPHKQWKSDPLPTLLLKENVDVQAPFLTELFNPSVELGVVPTTFKAAFITPLLKKSDLEPDDVKSDRPISNLSVMSKLLERLLARQLIDYMTALKLLPELQSAYRAHHSTETAVLKVLGDILLAVESCDLAVLTLLDLSAAFDTVDHATLLRRHRVSYGLGEAVIDWFKFTSYVDGRTQHLRCGRNKSKILPVLFGVPQGSFLGPILFLRYMADVLRLIEITSFYPHFFANDAQIYGFCHSGGTDDVHGRLSDCISDVCSVHAI